MQDIDFLGSLNREHFEIWKQRKLLNLMLIYATPQQVMQLPSIAEKHWSPSELSRFSMDKKMTSQKRKAWGAMQKTKRKAQPVDDDPIKDTIIIDENDVDDAQMGAVNGEDGDVDSDDDGDGDEAH